MKWLPQERQVQPRCDKQMQDLLKVMQQTTNKISWQKYSEQVGDKRELVPPVSTLQCSSSILLRLKLYKGEVLFDPYIRDPAIFIKVPLQISNSRVDRVKVDHEQGFGRFCIGWRPP